MSTTHTPGPWHQLHRQPLCIESPTGNVALCNLARSNEADARLIAAAPELLEALENLYALVQGECPSLLEDDHHDVMVSAAIAKATGR